MKKNLLKLPSSFISKYCILVLLIAGAQPSVAQENTHSTEYLKEQGDAQYDQKNYENAIPFYTELADREHNNSEILTRTGLCYFNLSQYEDAKKYFRLAVLYSNNNALYISNLGACYIQLKDYERGSNYALKALSINETNSTLFNAASLANQLGKPDDCINLLNKSKLPRHNDNNKFYAEAYYQKGDMEKSVHYYNLFFNNFYQGESDEQFDYYNQLYHYYKDLMNNFQSNVSDKNNKENYLSKIDTLYNQLYSSDQKEKTIDKTVSVMRYILSKNKSYIPFFKKLVTSTPGGFSSKYENMYWLYHDYEKMITHYENQPNLESNLQIRLCHAYLMKYTKAQDEKLENKILNLYIKNNQDLVFLESIIMHIYDIIDEKPETKKFFLKLAEKTKDEKNKNEIIYEFTIHGKKSNQ